MGRKKKVEKQFDEPIEIEIIDQIIEEDMSIHDKINAKLITSDIFCDLKSVHSRTRFVLANLHKKEQKTEKEWLAILKKHGLE
jgi:hypothetical protein